MLTPVPPRASGPKMLNALDLAGSKSGTLKGRATKLEALDLAQPAKGRSRPLTTNARDIAEYTASRAGISKPLFPGWASARPEYGEHSIKTSNPEISRTCEEMEKLIHQDVENYVNEVDYNGLNAAMSFIDFYDQEHAIHEKKSVAEIFHDFVPHSEKEASATFGTNCVGKAQDVARRLEKQYHIEAHVVVVSEGPNLPVEHAAVVVPCRDGVVLVEVDLPDTTFVLRPNEPFGIIYRGEQKGSQRDPDLMLAFRIVETPLGYKEQEPMITRTHSHNGKKVGYIQYILRPDKKP